MAHKRSVRGRRRPVLLRRLVGGEHAEDVTAENLLELGGLCHGHQRRLTTGSAARIAPNG